MHFIANEKLINLKASERLCFRMEDDCVQAFMKQRPAWWVFKLNSTEFGQAVQQTVAYVSYTKPLEVEHS